MRWTLVFCLIVSVSAGCTRVVVRKDPGPCDDGFRYYRPKPYLMITPGEPAGKANPALFTSTTRVEQGAELRVRGVSAVGPDRTSAQGEAAVQPAGHASMADQCVPFAGSDAPSQDKIKASISLLYLPDFAEEYAVQLKPGLGIGELDIKLDNGWNLTSVGVKTDQQTAEIITSVANLVGSVGDAVQPSQLAPPATSACPLTQVLATNIPFGLYEAVISTDNCGKKRLFGWRYVGFMPFQSCPVDAAGMEFVACGDPNAIYGLVLDGTGTMRFEKIAEIPHMEQATGKIKYCNDQLPASPN